MQPRADATTPFIGRAPELAVLDGALATARAGAGRIMLLVGPPGIGKTRLTEEFTRRALAAQAEVLAGRCFEGAGAPAFWPWTQVVEAYARPRDAATLAAELGTGAADVAGVVPALHAHLPGLGAPPQVGVDEARFRFFDGLTRALIHASTRQPVVLVLEDLHGADRSSLLLLQFMAREFHASHVLLVGTLRDVALAPGHPLAATLGELVREQVGARMDLVGLDRAEVTELMHRMAGVPPPPDLAHDVFARTEGNPLYVTEVLRALLGPDGFAARGAVTIPATVRSAIGAHLSALSPAAHATLTVAALFGRDFRLDVVARAAAAPVATILAHVDEAVTARVAAVHPGEPGRYRFTHALFGETLAEALGETERVALHLQAATALAADGHPDALVPEIAHHWFTAGPGGAPAEAVAWTRRAADRALGVLAHEEAAEWYRRALTTLEWAAGDDPSLRAELLLGLGEAHKRAGAMGEARTSFERAATLARALGSAEILTRAALGYAPAIAWAETPHPDPPVVSLIEEAIAAWNGRDASLHACALARLAVALLFGEPVRRRACAEAALAMARRLEDPGCLRYTLAAWFNAYHERHEVEKRLALATELVRLADSARDLEALAVGRLWRHTHLIEQGDASRATAEHAAFTRVVAELRTPVWRWQLMTTEALRHILAGRFAEAEVTSGEALAIGRSLLPYAAPAFFICQIIVVRLLQGRVEYTSEYRSIFEQHPDRSAVSPLVWMYCQSGHPEEAQAIFEGVVADDFAAIRGSGHWLLASLFLALGCVALGDAERAAWLYRLLLPRAAEWVVWAEAAPLGPVAYALGLLARTMGRLDEGAVHFERAIAASRRMSSPPFLALALREYADLLQRRGGEGDTMHAQRLLEEARSATETLGMEGLAANIPAPVGGQPAQPASPEAVATAAAGPNVCRREADYWVIVYGGTTIRLRNARGMHYLATLLHHPGREFHATALAAGNDPNDPNAAVAVHDDAVSVRPALDDGAGDAPDARAAGGYRRRLRDLDEDLIEAERHHDLGRAEHTRAEQHLLRAELVAAVRGRRGGTHAERARVTVTKGIGAVLARIAVTHPALAAHLRATVRRGYFCAYIPDPRHPIVWEG